MNENKLSSLCDRVIAFGLPLTGAAIVLAIDPRSMEPLAIKTFFLHAGTAIVFAAWLVKRLVLGEIGFRQETWPMLLPAFLFALSAVVSYVLVSQYKMVSHEELVQRVPYFLVFLVAVTEFGEPARRLRAVRWILGAAAAAAVFGMLQHFQLNPFGLKGAFIERIPSTFGNPNFYAGFLALVIPVAGSMVDFSSCEARKKSIPILAFVLTLCVVYYLLHLLRVPLWVKGVLTTAIAGVLFWIVPRISGTRLRLPAMLFAVLVLNILITSSRSGQIALAVGVLCWVWLRLRFFSTGVSRKRRIVIVAMTSVALVGAAAAGVSWFSVKRENSVVERSYYALSALDLFAGRPILGHGIGTFKVNYPLVKPREAWGHQTLCFANVRNVYNEHLEILHDEGIVGGALFLWLLAVAFLRSFRNLSKDDGCQDKPERGAAAGAKLLSAGILAGIVALLVSNIVSLSMRYVSTGFHFWYLLGLLGACGTVSERKGNPESGGCRKGRFRFTSIMACLLLIGAAGFTAVQSWRIQQSGRALARAVAASKRAYTPRAVGDGEVSHDIYLQGVTYESNDREWETAIRHYRTAIELNPRSLPARYFLANAYNRRWNMKPGSVGAWGDEPGTIRTDADRALEQYVILDRENPHYTEMDFELGDLYTRLGDLDSALHYYKMYKKYKPYFIKINHALARCYVARKEWQEAEIAYQDALNNNEVFTLGNVELSTVYHMLGEPVLEREYFDKAFGQDPDFALRGVVEEYRALGERDKAFEYMLRMIEREPRRADLRFELGWHCVQEESWDKAIAAFREAIALDSTMTRAYINLSNVLYTKGDVDGAKKVFERAMRIDPQGVELILERARSR